MRDTWAERQEKGFINIEKAKCITNAGLTHLNNPAIIAFYVEQFTCKNLEEATRPFTLAPTRVGHQAMVRLFADWHYSIGIGVWRHLHRYLSQ